MYYLGLVFGPLLLAVVFLAALYSVHSPSVRHGKEQKRHFAAMLQTFFLHLPLFLTEILVVVNAEAGGTLSWTAIFTPMYVLSGLSIAACIIGCCIKHCNIEVSRSTLFVMVAIV